MKLGELLALRAELQKRMKQLQQRLLDNATMQEGDTPALDSTSMLAQYRNLCDEHESVVRTINLANIEASVDVGAERISLANAIVRRERLARHAEVLRELTARAMPERSRFLRTEVKHVPTFDVAGVMAQADDLSRQHRELDTEIQRINWQVDVRTS